MGWTGGGAFTRLYSWTNDAANGIDIDATRMDADTNNITNNGFGNCLTRDGQGSATANLPMNGYLHINVANATLANQYSAAGQVQGFAFNYAGGTGSSDAITASYTPSPTIADGLLLQVKAPGANTTTTPTFAPNGNTAVVITKAAGGALVAGDYKSGQILQLEYVSSGPYWELLNPNYATLPAALVEYSGSLVSGNFPKWSGTAGTVVDSALAVAALQSFSGSLTGGNIAKWSGTAGVSVDAGIAAANLPLLSNNGSDYTAATFRANIGFSSFTTTAQTPSSSASYSAAHGLGAIPAIYSIACYIVNTGGTDVGHSTGDIVAVGFGGSSRNDGVSAWANGTNVGFDIGPNGIFIMQKGGGPSGGFGINTSKWQIYVILRYN